MVRLANHGVAHTLTTSLRGNSTLVMAYAVANSARILTPTSPRPHQRSRLVSLTSQPRFRIYPPMRSVPSRNHLPSLMYGGSQLA